MPRHPAALRAHAREALLREDASLRFALPVFVEDAACHHVSSDKGKAEIGVHAGQRLARGVALAC